MNVQTSVNLIILAGIIGFALYCLSYAGHVWRTRNGALPITHRGRRGQSAGRWAVVLAAAGLLITAGGIAVQSLITREGRLVGVGVITVRPRAGLNVVQLASQGPVQTGATLIRFSSPETEAQIQSMTLHRQVLALQRGALLRSPAELSPELVRQQQEITAERRDAQSLYDQLLPDEDQVAGTELQERTARLEEIRKIDSDLETNAGDLVKAEAKQELAQQQFAQFQKLLSKKAATADEVAKYKTAACVADAEVQELHGQNDTLEAQKRQIESDLKKLAQTAQSQITVLDGEMQGVNVRLPKLLAEGKGLNVQLDADSGQAQLRKQAALNELDVEMRQCDAELQGLKNELKISSPFAGRVVYRNPAPQTAQDGDPLIVVAPPGAFRVKLALDSREVASLARTGKVMFALNGPWIERRFEAVFQSARPIAYQSGESVVELTCNPPPEAARAVALGSLPTARLLWMPPFYTFPTTWFGIVLILIAGSVYLRGRKRAAHALAPGQRAMAGEPTAETVCAFADSDGGANGKANGQAHPLVAAVVPPDLADVRSMGISLRRGILREEIDPRVLTAIEEVIDRCHSEEMHVLAKAIGDADALLKSLLALMHTPTRPFGTEERTWHVNPDLAGRLVRTLFIIGAIGIGDGAAQPAKPSRPDSNGGTSADDGAAADHRPTATTINSRL